MLQSSLPAALTAVPFRQLAVVVSVLAVFAALRRLTGVRLLSSFRRRLLFGLPWGTLLTMAGVLAVYLFVQGAWWESTPLVTPFRTWSYFYPLGMLTGAFTHANEAHITGNLLGTLVYGTVVEYVWGHYPQRRGVQTFSSLRSNPFARILVVPPVMALVGLFTGVFAVGPVVGFSGVVFALAGFAILAKPYLFLGALLGSRVISQVYRALQSPEPTVGGSVQFVTPWWADIAIQAHAIGLFAGIGLAAVLLWSRGERPATTRVFFAALVFAVSNGLWAIYAPVGSGRFTLFRWLGTTLVFLLALLIATATTTLDRRLLPRFERDSVSVAGLVLLVFFGAICLASVPLNTVSIGPDDIPENGVEVRDYVVTYDEDIQNEYVANIPIPDRFGTNTTNVTESGVIIASANREIWITAVPKGRLALSGEVSVDIGGVGWRETVYANRTGWAVAGNDSVYAVSVRRDGGDPQTVFRSPSSTAEPTITGKNVTFSPTDSGFNLTVRRGNRSLASGPVPANATTRELGGLTFERNRSRLYVSDNGTRVRIAQKPQGSGR